MARPVAPKAQDLPYLMRSLIKRSIRRLFINIQQLRDLLITYTPAKLAQIVAFSASINACLSNAEAEYLRFKVMLTQEQQTYFRDFTGKLRKITSIIEENKDSGLNPDLASALAAVLDGYLKEFEDFRQLT